MNVAAPVKPSLTLKRRIKASPAKVFAAWTDPKLMARWLGPVGTVELTAKTDLARRRPLRDEDAHARR